MRTGPYTKVLACLLLVKCDVCVWMKSSVEVRLCWQQCCVWFRSAAWVWEGCGIWREPFTPDRRAGAPQIPPSEFSESERRANTPTNHCPRLTPPARGHAHSGASAYGHPSGRTSGHMSISPKGLKIHSILRSRLWKIEGQGKSCVLNAYDQLCWFSFVFFMT